MKTFLSFNSINLLLLISLLLIPESTHALLPPEDGGGAVTTCESGGGICRGRCRADESPFYDETLCSGISPCCVPVPSKDIENVSVANGFGTPGGDCKSNSVLYCGAFSKNTWRNKINNGDGLHSSNNLRQIYFNEGRGITMNEFMSSNTVDGVVKRNGDVLVNGQIVARNVLSTGRRYLTGSTKSGSLWARPPSVSFLVPQIAAYVNMQGSFFNWAILKSCGNIIQPDVPPRFTISGNVFNDTNKNRLLDSNETNYIDGIVISASGGTVSANSSTGTYTISNLPTGTYTISFTSPLPTTYQMVYPRNGPPSSFAVQVGFRCSVDTTTGASCNAGNISNLNFAITNSIPWMQVYGLDVRMDNGFTSIIPKNSRYPPYASVKN